VGTYGVRIGAIALAAAILASFVAPATAETLAQALAAAYSDNPTLNAQRASLRATDEGVPQALSGYRPTIFGSASVSRTDTNLTTPFTSKSIALTIQQPLFLGFRTTNSVRMAETAVLAGREVLRNTEQAVLLDAATAYVDVILAQALVSIRSQNIEFLNEQVRAANDRLNVGEGTRTDVAQTDAALALGRSNYSTAIANLSAARATYQQIVGHAPKALGSIMSIDKFLPRNLDAALAKGRDRHPAILASAYNIDVAAFNVKFLEGQLLPSVTLEGNLARNIDQNGPNTGTIDSASIVGRISVPIYQGGLPSSQVRQAKENLGQARIQLDISRDQVRQAIVASWGALDAARAQIEATNSQVNAEQLALSGIIEERKVGQRTTLDVLTSQQDLLTARILQVTAQRDRVVAAYSLLASVGGLDVGSLGLPVTQYQPKEHYRQVRDKWFGLRTPDGR
jgi:outer membrane protein